MVAALVSCKTVRHRKLKKKKRKKPWSDHEVKSNKMGTKIKITAL